MAGAVVGIVIRDVPEVCGKEAEFRGQQESLEAWENAGRRKERAVKGGDICYLCSICGRNMCLPAVADKQKEFRIKLGAWKSSPTVSVLRCFNSITKG